MVLTKDELAGRMALLKKLKDTLRQQREKFKSYMQVLEAEKNSIEGDRVDRLKFQVEIEDNLVVEIHNFQKVIDPLEEIWQMSYPQEKDAEVEEIRETLERLKTQVLEKNQKNRGLLSEKMAAIRGEILRVKPNIGGRNPYSTANQVSTMVDITT